MSHFVLLSYTGVLKVGRTMQLAVICNHGMQLWGRGGIALGCNFYFCIVPAFRGKCQGFVLYMQKIAVQPA